jgi:hypothetical protein
MIRGALGLDWQWAANTASALRPANPLAPWANQRPISVSHCSVIILSHSPFPFYNNRFLLTLALAVYSRCVLSILAKRRLRPSSWYRFPLRPFIDASPQTLPDTTFGHHSLWPKTILRFSTRCLQYTLSILNISRTLSSGTIIERLPLPYNCCTTNRFNHSQFE